MILKWKKNNMRTEILTPHQKYLIKNSLSIDQLESNMKEFTKIQINKLKTKLNNKYKK